MRKMYRTPEFEVFFINLEQGIAESSVNTGDPTTDGPNVTDWRDNEDPSTDVIWTLPDL